MFTLSRQLIVCVRLRSSHSRSKRILVCAQQLKIFSFARPSIRRYLCDQFRRRQDPSNPPFAVPEKDNASSVASSNDAPSVAIEGDQVTLHFTVFGEQGDRLESSRDAGQPLTFEVGSSGAVGNELLQAFDGGVRGLAVGDAKPQVSNVCRCSQSLLKFLNAV